LLITHIMIDVIVPTPPNVKSLSCRFPNQLKLTGTIN
jgi:hypothetical protein